jgi:hypothetical protein
MKNDLWYDRFLESLYAKYPKKSQLTEALMDLLSVEREAVYRRLRKDVLFSVYELAKIAKAWNLSLDSIMDVSQGGNHLFQMRMLKYVNPSEEDYQAMECFVDSLDDAVGSPESEYMEISNTVPSSLFSGFPHLSRFYTFKWMYRYGGEENSCSYSQIVPSERLRQLELAHHNGMKNIANVHYIWDRNIIDYLISDINYFSSIYLITEEDVKLIKKDIYALLDYMEDVSKKGYFPETNNNVNLYISQTNVDTGYAYYSSNAGKLSMIRTFIMNVSASRDEKVFDNLKKWIHLKKRSSVQISGVDEKQRIDFFMAQRQLVDKL